MADNTKISDEGGRWDRTMEERLAILVKNYRYLADLYQNGIDVTGEEGDDPTQDIFIEFKTATEKRIWMIQAHLGKAPEIDA